MSKKDGTKHSVREKEFKIRNSPLTERFENNKDIQTVYNVFSVILISLFVNTIIYDYFKTGDFHFGLRLILLAFNKFDRAIFIWLILVALSVLTFFSFQVWARIRTTLKPNSIKLWDRIWLTLLILYIVSSFYVLQKVITIYQFYPGSASCIVLEHIRLLMKQYGFLRTNAPPVLNYKPHNDKNLILPTLKKFIYFLFAPTFLYRDTYPRTRNIRWKFVVLNLAEIIGIIFLLSLVTERFLIPPFEEFCLRKYRKSEVIITVVGNSFAGILYLLGGFYSVLHAAQNAFAELLRFGDRMFYREWWTSHSFSEYYRTWNVIVHEWLHTYIYRDMYEIIVPQNKFAAKLAVFGVSAIVHEWIMISSLRIFLPVMFVEFFTAGVIFTLLKVADLPVGNMMVWYCIVFGSGIQVNLYTLEFFARRNCPSVTNDYFDFFKPKFLTCDCIE